MVQTNKQTSKQRKKQTNKQTNKQTVLTLFWLGGGKTTPPPTALKIEKCERAQGPQWFLLV